MYTKYEKYELLELFGGEPVYISCEETGMCIYRKEFSNGFNIVLSLSIYESKCTIAIGFHSEGILDVSLDNVEYLRVEGDGLRIHQNNATIDYVIYFRPNLFVKIE